MDFFRSLFSRSENTRRLDQTFPNSRCRVPHLRLSEDPDIPTRQRGSFFGRWANFGAIKPYVNYLNSEIAALHEQAIWFKRSSRPIWNGF